MTAVAEKTWRDNFNEVPEHLIPAELRDFEPVAVICNIYAIDLAPVMRTYGQYTVANPGVGERYALTKVMYRYTYRDMGGGVGGRSLNGGNEEDKRAKDILSARAIAEDICQDINSNAGGNSFWGKFVCKGQEPTEAELEAAEERLRTYFTWLVNQADSQWSQSRRHDMIDGRSVRAAKHLNIVDRDWLSNVKPMVDCPVCGEAIKRGVAMCRHCTAILDQAKAAAYGIEGVPARAAAEPDEEIIIAGIDDSEAPAAKPHRARKPKPEQVLPTA